MILSVIFDNEADRILNGLGQKANFRIALCPKKREGKEAGVKSNEAPHFNFGKSEKKGV